MIERPHDGPLPLAHPVAHGRPPTADGDRVPQPPRPQPPARRHLLAGGIAAAVVLALMVAGIAGWWA
ncbi:hypothetical protein O7602_26565 [Micromonospora sp. WMMD1128]|uniref:hypothetical protein n=1 Tax=Micromonospora sp. WMMD1128 TaxID=3015150 RepID=UPI00248B2F68|nr:hypothetical protein [Micromonospora sp. WMMD1128]WBB73207.1 hypothetical protein O7602_26565 [Micromonospora sp. WMMD1128]